MSGKRACAESIAQTVASEGEYGAVPFEYFVVKAAETLNCSAIELMERPDLTRWLTLAATIRTGEFQGNEDWKKLHKKE